MIDYGKYLQNAYDDGYRQGVEDTSRKYELVLQELRSRCYPGAEECFDRHLWGLLKIVTVAQ